MADPSIKKQGDPIKTNAPRVDLALIKILEKNNLGELARAIEKRSDVGLRIYGDRLRPFNGRDAKTDLYQELLDAMMYAMQISMEKESMIETGLPILMTLCEELRLVIDE